MKFFFSFLMMLIKIQHVEKYSIGNFPLSSSNFDFT